MSTFKSSKQLHIYVTHDAVVYCLYDDYYYDYVLFTAIFITKGIHVECSSQIVGMRV